MATKTFSVAFSFDADLSATSNDANVSATPLAATAITIGVSNPSSAYATNILSVRDCPLAASPTQYASTVITAPGAWACTGIALKGAKGNTSAPRGFQARTSADGFAANLAGGGNIPSTRPTLTPFTLTPPSGAITGGLELRLLMYSNGVTNTVEYDDLVITGTYDPAAVVTPTAPTWAALSSPGSAAPLTLVGVFQGGVVVPVTATIL